jgi:hypothetical protein
MPYVLVMPLRPHSSSTAILERSPGAMDSTMRSIRCVRSAAIQGLTLVNFSAQLEPCLTQESTLHTINTSSHPLNTGYTTPKCTPYPILRSS